MNSNAWMSQTVHVIGGLTKTFFVFLPASDNCEPKLTKIEIAGCAILGGDVVLRIVSHSSLIGDNAYIQGTLQITPVVQTALGLWFVGGRPRLASKTWGTLLAADGALRLYENYEAYRQKHQENQQEK